MLLKYLFTAQVYDTSLCEHLVESQHLTLDSLLRLMLRNSASKMLLLVEHVNQGLNLKILE